MARETFSTSVAARRNAPRDGLDDYPTPPWATRILTLWALPVLGIDLCGKSVWEPAANRGYMVRTLEETGTQVRGTDVADYGAGFPEFDFLTGSPMPEVDWVITNPPFSKAAEFWDRARMVAREGVALFSRIQWAEGQKRYDDIFADHPPAAIVVHPKRISLRKGMLDQSMNGTTMHAWFIWDRSALVGRVDTRFMWCPMNRVELEREGDYDV